MKNVLHLILIAGLLLSFSGQATAQNREPLVSLENELEAARKIMRNERKLLIAEQLQLTSEESKAFWPVFNDYEADSIRIGDRRVRLLTEYVENYAAMTPELADRLLEESLKIESDLAKLRRKYVRKFRKVLPVIKVARLYQIDNKLTATVNYQLATNIPLVEDSGKR